MTTLHFFAPTEDDPAFESITGGHLWWLLRAWQKIAPSLDVEVIIAPSPEIDEFQRIVRKHYGKDHPIIHRTVTRQAPSE